MRIFFKSLDERENVKIYCFFFFIQRTRGNSGKIVLSIELLENYYFDCSQMTKQKSKFNLEVSARHADDQVR